MLTRFCRERLGRSPREALEGRDALVLGSGGAGRAVRYALETFAGAQVSVISRGGPDGYEGLASPPSGRSPHRQHDARRDVSELPRLAPRRGHPDIPPNLAGVLDVVYNPVRTGLVLLAERLGIPAESGLAMLVAQALYASELFQGTALDDAAVQSIEHEILSQTENVVLIGMPGAERPAADVSSLAFLAGPSSTWTTPLALETGRGAAQIIEEDGERGVPRSRDCGRTELRVALWSGHCLAAEALSRRRRIATCCDRTAGSSFWTDRSVSSARTGGRSRGPGASSSSQRSAWDSIGRGRT